MLPGFIGSRSSTTPSGGVLGARAAIGGVLLAAALLFPAAAHAQMRTGSYVGDGLDNRRITGVGFQPAVVLIKADTGQNAVMRTSTMAGDALPVWMVENSCSVWSTLFFMRFWASVRMGWDMGGVGFGQ